MRTLVKDSWAHVEFHQIIGTRYQQKYLIPGLFPMAKDGNCLEASEAHCVDQKFIRPEWQLFSEPINGDVRNTWKQVYVDLL